MTEPNRQSGENEERIIEIEIVKRNAARIARRRSIHPSYGYLV